MPVTLYGGGGFGAGLAVACEYPVLHSFNYLPSVEVGFAMLHGLASVVFPGLVGAPLTSHVPTVTSGFDGSCELG